MNEVVDFVLDIWSVGIIGKVIFTIISLLVLLVFYCIYGLLYNYYDMKNTEEQYGMAEIQTKHHAQAWIQYVHSGKTMVPIYHPDSWSCVITIDGKSASIGINRDFYNNISGGDIIHISYHIGRFSGNIGRINIIGNTVE